MQVMCNTCGKMFERSEQNLRKHNFCCNECRGKWFGEFLNENVNIQGHSSGHKAPHLTALNMERNPKLKILDKDNNTKTTDTRKIMTKYLGRPLLQTEEVHHVNGDRSDNRIENLSVMDRKKHRRMHVKMAEIKLSKGGDEV